MRVVIATEDASEVLADTQITVGHPIRLVFPRPPKEIRVALVKNGALDRKRTLCLIFK